MSYLTVAPLVLVKVAGVGDDFRVDYHYAGSVIPALTAEQAERLVSEGFVVEQADNPAEVDGEVETPSGDGDPAATGPVKPKHAALKEEWEKYVVAVTAGTDAPVSPEDAAETSKADLITLYG